MYYDAFRYFLNGSRCLNGAIPVYSNDTSAIGDFCQSQAEKGKFIMPPKCIKDLTGRIPFIIN